jgi:hypothetical protein
LKQADFMANAGGMISKPSIESLELSVGKLDSMLEMWIGSRGLTTAGSLREYQSAYLTNQDHEEIEILRNYKNLEHITGMIMYRKVPL